MTTNKAGTTETKFSVVEKWLVGLAIGLTSLGLLIFIVSIFFFKHGEEYSVTEKINADKIGNFGSFISGVVGTVWTLVSVVLFYLTLRLQRKELSLQRKELELTRNELRGQKDELEKANSFSAIQQFDNKFFQLIGLHNEIRNGILVDIGGGPYFGMINERGVQFFQRLALMIAELFHRNDESGTELTEQKLVLIYQVAFHEHKGVLGHYFRNLFHIVRIIDENELLKPNQKKDYIKILRAQLSQYELVLLAYNGMTNHGEKFYPLINKYELLKNIDFELSTPANHVAKIVSPSILTSKYEHLKCVHKYQIQTSD